MSDKRNVHEQCSKLEYTVQRVRPLLEALETDFKLMADPTVSLTVCVDFHDIHEYANPLASLLKGGRSLREEEHETVVRRHVARLALLFGFGPCDRVVLLPSYMFEMHRFVGWLRRQGRQASKAIKPWRRLLVSVQGVPWRFYKSLTFPSHSLYKSVLQ